MKCILCEQEILESDLDTGCKFHPGRCTYTYMTNALGTRADHFRGYTAIYSWSCCGRQEPSQSTSSDISPDRVTEGCVVVRNHIFNAKVLLITAGDFISLYDKTGSYLLTERITAIHCSLENILPELLKDISAVIFLIDEKNNKEAENHIEKLQQKQPRLPVIVFSDPAKINEWKIQVVSNDSVTDKLLLESIKDAIRRNYYQRPKLKHHIFLSYSRKDIEIMGAYSEDFGHFESGCWIDENVLSKGVIWSNEIVTAIKASAYFVLLLTPNTLYESYCWKELTIAIKAKKELIFVISYGDSLSFFFEKIKSYKLVFYASNKDVTPGSGFIIRSASLGYKSEIVLFDPIQLGLSREAEDELRWKILEVIRVWPLSIGHDPNSYKTYKKKGKLITLIEKSSWFNWARFNQLFILSLIIIFILQLLKKC